MIICFFPFIEQYDYFNLLNDQVLFVKMLILLLTLTFIIQFEYQSSSNSRYWQYIASPLAALRIANTENCQVQMIFDAKLFL